MIAGAAGFPRMAVLPRAAVRHRAAAVVAAVSSVVWLTACTGQEAPQTLEPSKLTTQTVVRQTITSAVSMDAEVVEDAVYRLGSPARGTWKPAVKSGRAVSKSSVLGTVRDAAGKDHPVRSAGPGVVVRLAAAGPVAENESLASVRAAGFVLAGKTDLAGLYRLVVDGTAKGARAQINNGPGPFDCGLLGSPEADDQGAVTVLCAPPEDLVLFARLPGILAVTLDERTDVLTLPIGAVAGSSQQGTVAVVAGDNRLEERTVGLGITDGSRIEITSGLAEGDRVAAVAPNLRLPR